MVDNVSWELHPCVKDTSFLYPQDEEMVSHLPTRALLQASEEMKPASLLQTKCPDM